MRAICRRRRSRAPSAPGIRSIPNGPSTPGCTRFCGGSASTFLRDRSTRTRLLEEGAPDWLVVTDDAQAGHPALDVEREDLRRRVATAIEGLPPRDREVLVLKEFEDLKYREIADLLGVAIGTVMSRL